MSDVHIPELERHGGRKSILRIVLEVALIGVGVFLGLAGEQWRERTHQRELANEALRRFRTELAENRQAVADVLQYHAKLLGQLRAEFDLPPAKRTGEHVELHGIRPVHFNRSAWDLALATQSLAYVDPDLALALSKLYNAQDFVTDLEKGLLQAMYIVPPDATRANQTFYASLLVFYSDMSDMEPKLLQTYDELLPKLERRGGS